MVLARPDAQLSRFKRGRRFRPLAAMPLWALATILPSPTIHAAQDDVADVRSRDLRAGGDENKRFFLIGPKGEQPADGFGLLLVMPGGDGSADFQPFVKRIFKKALPEGFIIAQLVAHKASPTQEIVWPTAKTDVPGKKFSTEEFVEAVVAQVGKEHKLNHRRVFTLAWSSSGPAAYAVSLQEKTGVTGSYIAMSVFVPLTLPPLNRAKGHAYYIEHSREDRVCVFDFAERARQLLAAQGANVTLAEYRGGHGWHGDPFARIRTGINWLIENEGKTPPPPELPQDVLERAAKGTSGSSGAEAPAGTERPGTAPAEDGKKPAAASGTDTPGKAAKPVVETPAGPELLANGGFEGGLGEWVPLNNSGTCTMEVDRRTKSEGNQSLKISKTGGAPMDVLRCNIMSLPKGGRVKVSAMVKSANVKNSFFKFFIYDEADNILVEDVDIERITGTGDWKRVDKVFKVPENADHGAVMFVMVLSGAVWLDDVHVTTLK